MTVIAAVAGLMDVGKSSGVPKMALMRLLLPRLNSPTTASVN